MAEYDETEGWIFSDEYHKWQDGEKRDSHFRVTGDMIFDRMGWYIGAFTFKHVEHGQVPARWPEPLGPEDLDGPG